MVSLYHTIFLFVRLSVVIYQDATVLKIAVHHQRLDLASRKQNHNQRGGGFKRFIIDHLASGVDDLDVAFRSLKDHGCVYRDTLQFEQPGIYFASGQGSLRKT